MRKENYSQITRTMFGKKWQMNGVIFDQTIGNTAKAFPSLQMAKQGSRDLHIS
jgi:hypothetical protein